MEIAERLQRVKPSATLAVSAKAMELRAQGREIISLSIGQPDFKTPAHICEAAKKAIDDGFHGYTPVPGIPEVREAVAGYFDRFYGVKAEAANTIVTNGGKQSLYNLFQALVNPGDEVIVPAPYWVSYPAMVKLAGGEPVIVPTAPENDFKLTVADLDRAVSGRTKVLLLNAPSNPTGCAYTQQELDALAMWAVDRGLTVISDEIYDQLVYAPAKPASLSMLWEKFPENVVVCNGLAKSHAMTGWRVGYTLAHEELIKALSKIQGQSTSNVCSIAQKAAVAALTGTWEPVEEMRTAFAQRRDIVMDIISGWKNVRCPRPDGAFYVFPDVSACYTETIPDSATLCTKLLEEAGVALVPGVAFGDDRCVRISYALDEASLREALDKVAGFLRV